MTGQESTLVMSTARKPGNTSRSKKAAFPRRYRASYEDFAKASAAAKAEGASDDESLMDYIEPDNYRTGKTFATRSAAVRWLKAGIAAKRTCFGCGDVYEIEIVPLGARCDYCTCRGEKLVHRYLVTDDGIEGDDPIDDCAYED